MKIPQNEQEAEELLEMLKKNDISKKFDVKDAKTLRYIMDSTPYLGLRDLICIRLVEFEDEELYPYLIKKIKENIHTRYISTLVYCCSYYDCAEDVQLFIDLLILKSDMAFADALSVFLNMGTIDEEERKYAVNKLLTFLEIIGETDDRYNEINRVIRMLEKE